MIPPSVHVKEIIVEDDTFNVLPIYIGTAPASPAENITIYDTGGVWAHPEFSLNDLTVMITVRSKSYAKGYATAYGVKQLLEQLRGWSSYAWKYTGFWLVSGVNALGRNSDDVEEFTINFLTLREPTWNLLPVFDVSTITGNVTVSEDGLTATAGTGGGTVSTFDLFAGGVTRRGLYMTVNAGFTYGSLRFTGGGKSAGLSPVGMNTSAAVSPFSAFDQSLVGVELCLAVDSVGTYGTLYVYVSSTPNTPVYVLALDSHGGPVGSFPKFLFGDGPGAQHGSITILRTPTVSHSGVTNILG